MTTATISEFKKSWPQYLEQAAKFCEPVTVAMGDGNVVIMGEEEYRGLMATIELASDPKFYAQLKEAMEQPVEECTPAEMVEW
jgi:PHD/YefM family antitoxin component YafN of YafNO toxin-antitoxin module